MEKSTTPRESLPNGAAYVGPFWHLGLSRSPVVGITMLVMHKM